jgi:hypothetical protein
MGAATVGTALALTMLGAAGTGLGGLLVIIQPNMSFKRLGVLQVGLRRDVNGAPGVNESSHTPARRSLRVSLRRRTPPPPCRHAGRRAHQHARTCRRRPPLLHARAQGMAAGLMLCISMIDLLPAAIAEVGFVQANLCFYAGVLFFAAIVYLIPEPSPASIKVDTAGCAAGRARGASPAARRPPPAPAGRAGGLRRAEQPAAPAASPVLHAPARPAPPAAPTLTRARSSSTRSARC